MSIHSAIHPAPQPVLLDRFKDIIRDQGAAAARSDATRLDREGQDELFYIPFEHMNLDARLVIVGITPGPNQIAMAYEEAQKALKAGRDVADVLAQAKLAGSFGGPQMRPNLLKMLRAFGFPKSLGIDDPNDLWGAASHLLHATSVIPNATFRSGKPFASSFQDVLASRVMRESFERDFAATLPLMRLDAMYVALGPTPLAALDWCAERGLLRPEQVLGAFAHPSTTGGSQVGIYVGERMPEDLDQHDPVRGRVDWLLDAAAMMRRSVAAWGGAPTTPTPAVRAAPASAGPNELHAIIARGAHAGGILRPHVQDGAYIVSNTRFEKDYVRVPLDHSLEPWLARGFKLRMSAPGHAPSLIAPASIKRRTRTT